MAPSNFTVANANQLVGSNTILFELPAHKNVVGLQRRTTVTQTGPSRALRHEKRSIVQRSPAKRQPPPVVAAPAAVQKPYRDVAKKSRRRSRSAPLPMQPPPTVKALNAPLPPTPTLPKLCISTTQLDAVVSTLAKCPLLTTSVQKERLVFTKEAAVPFAKNPAQLYSQPNQSFAVHSAQNIAPKFKLINGLSGGAALFSATLPGNPLVCSTAPKPIANGMLRCLNMKLPPGIASTARLETALSKAPEARLHVMLQILSTMVDRVEGSLDCYLSSEHDVTASIKKAAIAELVRVSNVTDPNIEIHDIADSHEEFDLATARAIEQTIEAIRVLEAETCSMQTLTLMAELSRIKASQRDIAVLRPGARDEDGQFIKASVPLLTQSLYDYLREPVVGMNAEDMIEYIARIVENVRPCAWMEESFEIGKASRLVANYSCLPMRRAVGAAPSFWAIFMPVSVRALLKPRS